MGDLQKIKERLDAVSPTLCLAKWKNATIHLHNGQTQSCHHVASHDVGKNHLHNTIKKRDSRKKMLDGQRPDECRYCWDVEDNGDWSDRFHKSAESVYQDFFQEVVNSGTGATINPSFLEIAFENTCQFRCAYCSPIHSSSWQKEILQWGNYPTWGHRINSRQHRKKWPSSSIEKENRLKKFWAWWPTLRHDLRYLRVTGGEPFLTQHTFRLIDHLIDEKAPNLQFAVNTNLGFDPIVLKKLTERMTALQESVQHFLIFSSLDTWGPQAEYIRFGLDLQLFKKNVETILTKAKRPLTFCFMITVNNLSLPHLRELLEYIVELKRKFPQHAIEIDSPHLVHPEYLSVSILTGDFRRFLKEAVKYAKKVGVFSETEVQKLERIIPMIGSERLNPAKTF
ncbi:MAG: twitch domain-containing radical SAM protein, partial [Pseudomonadota bacterium]